MDTLLYLPLRSRTNSPDADRFRPITFSRRKPRMTALDFDLGGLASQQGGHSSLSFVTFTLFVFSETGSRGFAGRTAGGQV